MQAKSHGLDLEPNVCEVGIDVLQIKDLDGARRPCRSARGKVHRREGTLTYARYKFVRRCGVGPFGAIVRRGKFGDSRGSVIVSTGSQINVVFGP